MKLIDKFMLLAILFSFVVVKTNAHDDGTNHTSHHHPNTSDCKGDGGILILLIVFALLFFVSCCVNIYQFKLRHGNVITAEVEYNAFT